MKRPLLRFASLVVPAALAVACSLVTGIGDYSKCAAGQKLCEGRCESATDPLLGCANRESCAPCRLENTLVAACASTGLCAVGQCAPGFADCNGDPADGCEAELTDGAACPEKCPRGFADCNQDGVCECGYPNSNAVCLNDGAPAPSGACEATGCAEGFFDCNNVKSDGCEIDLQNDGKNCGTCGVSCQGGRCERGKCLPVIIAENQPSPGQILFDEAYVYWSNYVVPSQPASAVRRVSRDGFSTNGIADNQPYAYGIAIEGDYVYFTTGKFGTPSASDPPSVLGRANKKGDEAASPRILLRLPGRLRGIAYDDPFVYFAVYDYAADAGTTAGIDGPGIYRFNKASVGADAGGASVVLEKVAKASRPMNVVVSGAEIYWTEEGPASAENEGAVRKCASKAGCVGTEIAVSANLFRPRGLAVDADHVYFANVADPRNGKPSSIMKVKRDGSGEQKLAEGLNDARELAIDTGYVYFATYAGNAIYRMPKNAAPGSAPEIVVQNDPAPNLRPELPVAPLTVAVDPAFVYWSNYGYARSGDPVQVPGSVMRLAKP